MDKLTEKMINQDPILEVEKLLNNKSYKEFNDLENLFMLSQVAKLNQEQDKYLSSINDTHFRMSWQEFKTLIISKGFIKGMVVNCMEKFKPIAKKIPKQSGNGSVVVVCTMT